VADGQTVRKFATRSVLRSPSASHKQCVICSRERTLRVFVLTGAGDRVFVSGADVREFRDHLATPESALSYDAAAEQLQSRCARRRSRLSR